MNAEQKQSNCFWTWQ